MCFKLGCIWARFLVSNALAGFAPCCIESQLTKNLYLNDSLVVFFIQSVDPLVTNDLVSEELCLELQDF